MFNQPGNVFLLISVIQKETQKAYFLYAIIANVEKPGSNVQTEEEIMCSRLVKNRLNAF